MPSSDETTKQLTLTAYDVIPTLKCALQVRIVPSREGQMSGMWQPGVDKSKSNTQQLCLNFSARVPPRCDSTLTSDWVRRRPALDSDVGSN